MARSATRSGLVYELESGIDLVLVRNCSQAKCEIHIVPDCETWGRSLALLLTLMVVVSGDMEPRWGSLNVNQDSAARKMRSVPWSVVAAN